MAPQRKFSGSLAGIIFFSLVCAALARSIITIVARRNEAAALAAEQSQKAAAQAIEQAHRDETARVANRPRVERGIAGRWAGAFGSHSDARLSIARKGKSIHAVLLSGGVRETLRGEVLSDNRLMLTPIDVTRLDGGSARYSPDTIWLDLSADGTSLYGSYSDTNNSTGSVSLRKNSGQRDPHFTDAPSATETVAKASAAEAVDRQKAEEAERTRVEEERKAEEEAQQTALLADQERQAAIARQEAEARDQAAAARAEQLRQLRSAPGPSTGGTTFRIGSTFGTGTTVRTGTTVGTGTTVRTGTTVGTGATARTGTQ
jgi:hypothetical protein